MKSPTLVFVHGWGMDAAMWDALRAALDEWPHVTMEAGYFGQDTKIEADTRARYDLPVGLAAFILVGHSYGFIQGLKRCLDMPSCRGLISINGFPRFAQAQDFPEGVARLVIDGMISRLALRPKGVVGEFRRRCGLGGFFSEPQRVPLERDLRSMRDGDESSRLQKSGLPLLVLAGTRDPIVSASMTCAAFDVHSSADSKAQDLDPARVVSIEWCKNGGHLLPLSDAAWCAARIRSFLNALQVPPSPERAVFLRHAQIAARFGMAADDYDHHADVQRKAAATLGEMIGALHLPASPRILEIGCGTGFLTRALASRLSTAEWTITDIAEPMVRKTQTGVSLRGSVRFTTMNGEYPTLPPDARYDLICSSLAVQWFDDLDGGLARLAAYLAPGGYLAISTLASDTFVEWRRAHEACGLKAATPAYPIPAHIGANLRVMRDTIRSEHIVCRHNDGLGFLRRLKRIGAGTPAAGGAVTSTAALRRVLARFDSDGAAITYHLVYGLWRRPASPPRGVFVTGTDTGVGKTLTAAVLARAWQADYWKPCQTGLGVEAGDTETVAKLAQMSDERLHRPAYALQAPLSPWDAARIEGIKIDMARFTLPRTEAPLVVEGAGGVFVPITDTAMMIDLIGDLSLAVVLVARSGLGTINHTLLSLAALRSRGIPIVGVVMSGVLSPGNRDAIERFGQVKVLAEIPVIQNVDAAAICRLIQRMPRWDIVEAWIHDKKMPLD